MSYMRRQHEEMNITESWFSKDRLLCARRLFVENPEIPLNSFYVKCENCCTNMSYFAYDRKCSNCGTMDCNELSTVYKNADQLNMT